jgi:hypothetical protein
MSRPAHRTGGNRIPRDRVRGFNVRTGKYLIVASRDHPGHIPPLPDLAVLPVASGLCEFWPTNAWGTAMP